MEKPKTIIMTLEDLGIQDILIHVDFAKSQAEIALQKKEDE